jgi:hypothetical protein
MGSLASDMWHRAVDCWCQRNRSAAVTLGQRDEEMGELYAIRARVSFPVGA